MNSEWELRVGHALDLIEDVAEIDLVVTDPPYAFGAKTPEHELSATVAVVLRETAARLRRGSWMVVYSASSWRSINYMVESVRGILPPVRIASWVKPETRTQVRTVGWRWAQVSVIAMRKGPKNRPDVAAPSEWQDHISCPVVTGGRRAQLPESVASWSVLPFVVEGGVFLDPFAGSGVLPAAAASAGMRSIGFEIGSDGGAE
jgi:DNA modification methylase